jgi:hypothetical protein
MVSRVGIPEFPQSVWKGYIQRFVTLEGVVKKREDRKRRKEKRRKKGREEKKKRVKKETKGKVKRS